MNRLMCFALAAGVALLISAAFPKAQAEALGR